MRKIVPGDEEKVFFWQCFCVRVFVCAHSLGPVAWYGCPYFIASLPQTVIRGPVALTWRLIAVVWFQCA